MNLRPSSSIGSGGRRLIAFVRSKVAPERALVVPGQLQRTCAWDQNLWQIGQALTWGPESVTQVPCFHRANRDPRGSGGLELVVGVAGPVWAKGWRLPRYGSRTRSEPPRVAHGGGLCWPCRQEPERDLPWNEDFRVGARCRYPPSAISGKGWPWIIGLGTRSGGSGALVWVSAEGCWHPCSLLGHPPHRCPTAVGSSWRGGGPIALRGLSSIGR